jgi:hypothetical protein
MTKHDSSLDERIATALTATDTSIEQLEKLIIETETAICAASQAAQDADCRALDVTVVDYDAKGTAIEQHYLTERYEIAHEKLTVQLLQVRAKARRTQWQNDANQVAARRQTLIADCLQNYTVMLAGWTNMMEHVKAVTAEIVRINATAPDNAQHVEDLGLIKQIIAGVRLPNPENPQQFVWPIPVFINPEEIVPMTFDPRRYSADWWKVQQEEEEAARKLKLEEQQKLQAERDANYRGPRWWEGEKPAPERQQG